MRKLMRWLKHEWEYFWWSRAMARQKRDLRLTLNPKKRTTRWREKKR